MKKIKYKIKVRTDYKYVGGGGTYTLCDTQ